MKIAILVEGHTERVFLPKPPCLSLASPLRQDAEPHLARPYDGRIPKGDKLRRVVEDLLTKGPTPARPSSPSPTCTLARPPISPAPRMPTG